ncbi:MULTISPECIES: ABC transporter substrate-binding protein [Alphaproteobacteria]|uniref:ABC transporter substrate-binding protein n=1 Tax=Alphaproteobacteria TaxID=28211 RepID=UPI0019D333FA|nr:MULTISPECIES: ABC transporter substrate-binding protein [Alphaproteobacteria]MBY6022918.1 twin-arginine translocation pathway signal protein [Nitratireductor sp. DP7N14-4]MBN7758125.1 twin-arginine translocation pathway signal protein [Nitratireductor aquimarinus]MBN7760404.1 twin-arginine translocation pathway signal protein [Nitratireductor aquibiodomus]MBN7776286.1 twin-arginine translocation pathway signal protein [Nitratireductor pacificus]MBN7779153.1 twin-arginine translocation pathw
MRRAVVSTAFLALLAGTPAFAGDQIRTIDLFTRPQAAQPQEFQSIQLIAQEWRKLGLDVNVRVMPWEQMSDVVWYQRDNWDATAWQMVGRPERSDPDEIVFNLFHSTTADKGYNFIGYLNPEYDTVVEAERVEIDEAKRKELIDKAQEILAADQPNMMLVHPKQTFAFDKTVWDPASVVEQSGIGIRNTWTFMSLTPVGEQKDIILNSGDNVQAINPLYISGGVDSWVFELVYDRLVRVGPDGLPKAWAAESYEWKDDKTIAVTLREGMKWHDGEPVTPEDVKFSFETAVSGEAPMYAPFATNIENIAIDGSTITFTLKQPAASFVTSSLAKINLIPKHVWEPIIADLKTKEENAESYQEETPIGSGPFRFERWLTNEEIVLSANKDHFNAPKAERWILRIVPNVEAALGMLRSGEINFLAEFSGDPQVLLQAAEQDGDLETVSTVEMGFRYVAFNNRRPPFDDPAFRRALSSAVDRRLIVKAAYRGYAEPSNSVVSPALGFWHNEAVVEGFEAGHDVAVKILEDAGYTLEGDRLHYPGDQKETLAE